MSAYTVACQYNPSCEVVQCPAGLHVEDITFFGGGGGGEGLLGEYPRGWGLPQNRSAGHPAVDLSAFVCKYFLHKIRI